MRCHPPQREGSSGGDGVGNDGQPINGAQPEDHKRHGLLQQPQMRPVRAGNEDKVRRLLRGQSHSEVSPPLRVWRSILLRERQSGGACELKPVVQRHQMRAWRRPESEVVARRRRSGNDCEAEPGMTRDVQGVRIHRVVVVVASGTEEGQAVDARGGDGVVKDAEDGVGAAAGGEHGGIAREMGPVRAADGACDAAVADVRRDTREVESVHALGREDCVAAAIVQAERLQAYCT